ncbi:maleylpyruvate isomerase N-terminal domain-containing protein [Streptomyces mirabilis]|uniref:Maleylpyruvate isomerase N-terminal domain-containing protein n=1 Tax=Streptomyces mirabilis TaxID=68239 RepID=A0ABU3V4Z6_9ACTN|nr:maleylpyruvate isomerase N-terminal domain-containing protein [Streptomyces mirabilis]MCX5355596.1 maleylpyruvate isomerase N-terminal domain-containing protein [Streptomyces mirabilis]MDU9001242.1 maleylpyruvate isomerase N-terminal domain-containing protein [Streptomyces mirabilis]
MSLTDAYLGAAAEAVTLLGAPEVTASWEKTSALTEMTVGGLAGHLAYQVFSVTPALQESTSQKAPIPLLEHYSRAAWIDAPLDGEVNAGIRAKGEDIASEGAQVLLEHARAALAEQKVALPEVRGDWVVFMPQTGWALSLDDFLVTRMMELAVHMDDLAVSVGIAAPELSTTAFDPVLTLLARLAARRHGQAALLRALARAERAPSAINAL